jgi:hypothetical protein
MSLNLLKTSLDGFDAKWTVPVFAFLSTNYNSLVGADQHTIAQLAFDLSQLSGGAGLELISLLLWPDDSEVPQPIQDMVSIVKECLIAYEPGKAYPLSTHA